MPKAGTKKTPIQLPTESPIEKSNRKALAGNVKRKQFKKTSDHYLDKIHKVDRRTRTYVAHGRLAEADASMNKADRNMEKYIVNEEKHKQLKRKYPGKKNSQANAGPQIRFQI